MKNALTDVQTDDNKKNKFFFNKCRLLSDILPKGGDYWVRESIARQGYILVILEAAGLQYIPHFFTSGMSGIKTHTGIKTFPWCSHPIVSSIMVF